MSERTDFLVEKALDVLPADASIAVRYYGSRTVWELYTGCLSDPRRFGSSDELETYLLSIKSLALESLEEPEYGLPDHLYIVPVPGYQTSESPSKSIFFMLYQMSSKHVHSIGCQVTGLVFRTRGEVLEYYHLNKEPLDSLKHSKPLTRHY